MRNPGFENYLERAGLTQKAHQFEAVDWCVDRERNGRTAGGHLVHRGGIVADEMGLGKTIEMLGTMATNPLRRTLIIVPVPLLDQWVEAAKRGEVFDPLIFHGAGKKGVTTKDLEESKVVITTYGVLITSQDQLCTKVWSRVVCDEAHRLRNSRTRAHKAMTGLRARIRWLLTGTPVQNSKRDFHNLCRALGLRPHYYSSRGNLPELARHFILRRTKKSVGLTLPPLEEEEVRVQWRDEDESRLAADIHTHLSFSKVSELGGRERGKASRGAFGEHHLAMLVRARQACVCPPLMAKHLGAMVDASPGDKDWLRAGLERASKVQAVADHIRGRSRGDARKLVFCHFKGEIDALSSALEARGIRARALDGRTSPDERAGLLGPSKQVDPKREELHAVLRRQGLPSELRALVLSFVEGPEVLLIQIQMGCEGLNLQRFSEVYFVSPHWNPAVEDQAVARCHRIGQTKPVSVFRFRMAGFDAHSNTCSLEDYSARVQTAKRRIISDLVADARG